MNLDRRPKSRFKSVTYYSYLVGSSGRSHVSDVGRGAESV